MFSTGRASIWADPKGPDHGSVINLFCLFYICSIVYPYVICYRATTVHDSDRAKKPVTERTVQC